MKIDDLYFGVKLMPLSYNSEEGRTELKTYNLFDFSRIKWSVAKYVTMTDTERSLLHNSLMFCFGDVWSRAEYEFLICPWPYKDGEFVEQVGQKVDIFTMYVEPNAKLLMDMVNSVSVSSAKKYMTECRKRYKK